MPDRAIELSDESILVLERIVSTCPDPKRPEILMVQMDGGHVHWFDGEDAERVKQAVLGLKKPRPGGWQSPVERLEDYINTLNLTDAEKQQVVADTREIFQNVE